MGCAGRCSVNLAVSFEVFSSNVQKLLSSLRSLRVLSRHERHDTIHFLYSNARYNNSLQFTLFDLAMRTSRKQSESIDSYARSLARAPEDFLASRSEFPSR